MAEAQRVLGVPPEATADETKLAYFRLARQYHPDAVGLDSDESIDSLGEQSPTTRFTEVFE